MILHPALLGVLLADVLSLMLLCAASVGAMQILLNWSASSHDAHQIKLERAAESASLKGRAAQACFCFGTVLWLLAVTNHLPTLVPGAMCGMGVFQAMSGLGTRALAFRLLAIGTLYIFAVTSRLNDQTPEAVLTPMAARLILVSLPLVFLAVWYTFSASYRLNTYQAVDCCSVVYEQFQRDTGQGLVGIPGRFWVFSSAALGLVVLVGSVLMQRGEPASQFALSTVMAVSGILWAPAGYMAVTSVLCAYYFEVLHHHCPWCLFLSAHHQVGFILFGAVAVVLIESVAVWWVLRVTRSSDTLRAFAGIRARSGGKRVALAVLIFTILAAGPAILWRIRNGVWMEG